MKTGKIQVYTGDGKGKTTAALGLAFRALGQGFKVAMVQFMKGGAYTGEFLSAKLHPNFSITQYGRLCIKQQKTLLDWGAEKFHEVARTDIVCGPCRFCFLNDQVQQDYVEQGFEHAMELVRAKQHDIIILDEINVAMSLGFLNPELVLKMLDEKAQNVEIILTGRNVPDEIKKKADLVTEMKLQKHYYEDQGLMARRGIEY